MIRLSASCITPGQAGAAPSACNISTEYLPSDLEQLWLKHVQQWEPAFCNSLQALENTTQVWLKTLQEVVKLQDTSVDKSPAQVGCVQLQDSHGRCHQSKTVPCGMQRLDLDYAVSSVGGRQICLSNGTLLVKGCNLILLQL